MSEHEIRLGDCLDPVSGLASLPDKSVDHVIHDPPYSDRTHRPRLRDMPDGCPRNTVGFGFDAITNEDVERVAREVARVARRWALTFTDAEGIGRWIASLTAAGLEHVRVGAWVKLEAMPQFTGDRPAAGFEAIVIAHQPGAKRWNAGGKHGVWTIPCLKTTRPDERREHTTQKPLALMEALVSDFTDPGDLILDAFAGSGTTGVACKRLGRRFVGWERDPKYHAVAEKRIASAREQLGLFRERVPEPKQVSLLGAAPRARKGTN